MCRLVVRAADLVVRRDKTMAEAECARCGHTVVVDRVPPPGTGDMELICSRCVAADPELAAQADPGILAIVRRSHVVIDRLVNKN